MLTFPATCRIICCLWRTTRLLTQGRAQLGGVSPAGEVSQLVKLLDTWGSRVVLAFRSSYSSFAAYVTQGGCIEIAGLRQPRSIAAPVGASIRSSAPSTPATRHHHVRPTPSNMSSRSVRTYTIHLFLACFFEAAWCQSHSSCKV